MAFAAVGNRSILHERFALSIPVGSGHATLEEMTDKGAQCLVVMVDGARVVVFR